jgi:hypothetical protein
VRGGEGEKMGGARVAGYELQASSVLIYAIEIY